jgi:hypothetical protein
MFSRCSRILNLGSIFKKIYVNIRGNLFLNDPGGQRSSLRNFRICLGRSNVLDLVASGLQNGLLKYIFPN